MQPNSLVYCWGFYWAAFYSPTRYYISITTYYFISNTRYPAIVGTPRKLDFSTIKTKKTRSFKANFSNEVGQNIGEALGIILMNKRGSSTDTYKLLKSNNNIEFPPAEEKSREDTDFTEVSSTKSKKDRVFEIFNESGGNMTLLETRLKATSKRDYGIRLAILFFTIDCLKV